MLNTRQPICAFWICLAAALVAFGGRPGSAKEICHSPYDCVFTPDGRQVIVSDKTAGAVSVIDAAQGKVTGSIQLDGPVTGVALSADGEHAYAAEFLKRRVAEIDLKNRRVVRYLAAGPYPENLALAPAGNLLLVAGWGLNELRVIDLSTGETKGSIAMPRQPFDVAISPDESLAIVGNLLPQGRSTDADFAAVLSLVDLRAMEKRADVALPIGSSAVRGVAIGPEGKWAYAVHTVGRYNIPTTQVERGWVNTNALSVIDLEQGVRRATVLLDYPTRGAADPWGLDVSRDGSQLCVSISGAHEIGLVDVAKLHELVDGTAPERLVNDLSGMHRTRALRRVAIEGKGPRGVACSPAGRLAAVAVYFSGDVALVDTATNETTLVPLGKQSDPSAVRLGEQVFHDGNRCFQSWLSCATCHPGGRVDGLNWDLLNDGLGNPKNARSLVWSDRTPPMMSLGVRDKMETAAKAGFQHIQFTTPTDRELQTTVAYIKSLEPLESPYLRQDGSLTAAAERGKKVFEASGCANCHRPPLYTDLRMHDVGTREPMDRSDRFDTPALTELWRTGPYLHDGGAADLREVLIDRNPRNRHGNTSELTEQELEDLIEFLQSL